MSKLIEVSAVVLRDHQGRVLTVRKRGTHRFMLPGGKPEPGESPPEAAVRECTEELGIVLDPAGLALLGLFTASAANEPGHRVISTVFEHPAAYVGEPAGEIDEVAWVEVNARGEHLAPLLCDAVLPALRGRHP